MEGNTFSKHNFFKLISIYIWENLIKSKYIVRDKVDLILFQIRHTCHHFIDLYVYRLHYITNLLIQKEYKMGKAKNLQRIYIYLAYIDKWICMPTSLSFRGAFVIKKQFNFYEEKRFSLWNQKKKKKN
jgi:hypothetical protein